MAQKKLIGDLNVTGKIITNNEVFSSDNQPLNLKAGGTTVVVPYINPGEYVNCGDKTYDPSATYYVFNDEIGLEPAGEYTELTTEMQMEILGELITAENFDDWKDYLYIFEEGDSNTLTFPQKSGTVATTDDIKANPTLEGNEDPLSGIEINGVKFKAGGSDVHLYRHEIVLYRNSFGSDAHIKQINQRMVIIDDEPTAYNLIGEMTSKFVTKGYFKDFISRVAIFYYDNDATKMLIDNRYFDAILNNREYSYSSINLWLTIDNSTTTITRAEKTGFNGSDYMRTTIVSDTVTQIL